MELGYMFWALGELESMKALSLSLGRYVTQPIVADQHERQVRRAILGPTSRRAQRQQALTSIN